MSEPGILKHRRRRLLLLLAPGIAALLLPILAGPSQPRNPGLGGGEWRSFAPILALLLLGGGFLIHRRAVADFVSSRRIYWKTVLFITAPVVAGAALAILSANLAAGAYLAATSQRALPIFPPHSKVSFRTPEFAYTAEANSMGFRDHEVGPKAGFRIIALGDSFTYGWGVELPKSWPKIVEHLLNDQGRRTEVLNLGCPGASVDVYAEVAEQSLPLLKPDLVVVAVLQGDDLKQFDLGGTMQRLAGPRSSLGTLVARVSRPRAAPAEQVREEWRRGARLIPEHLRPDEWSRYESLDPEVKAMYARGDLSPHLLRDALKEPDYLAFTLETGRPEAQKAIAAMGRCFERIRLAASKQGARVMVLSVPWSYVSASALATKRRLGFRIDDEALRADAPDDAIRSASLTAGVEFHGFTTRFREAAARRKLFFEFDGHFNVEGHALYAEQVSRLLLEQTSLVGSGM